MPATAVKLYYVQIVNKRSIMSMLKIVLYGPEVKKILLLMFHSNKQNYWLHSNTLDDFTQDTWARARAVERICSYFCTSRPEFV